MNDERYVRAFDIDTDKIDYYIDKSGSLIQLVYGELLQILGKSFTPTFLLKMLWEILIPLSLQLIAAQQKMTRPLVQGILGGQGAGKTTLAIALKLILATQGYHLVSLSIDDLYKTYGDRVQLRAVDPRLIWRGPPGTHDIELGLETLTALLKNDVNEPLKMPRFDKSLWQGEGDRVAPEVINAPVDFVLFEGWFVGVRPVADSVFDQAPAPILTEADRAFARDMNAKLQDYLPLWNYLDRLMVLYLSDYQLSKQWRKQAEHQMIAQGKQGMTDGEIDDFVEYFWRSLHPELFITPLIKRPDLVDLVIEINPDHSPGLVYAP
ncbi:MAG TPA: hypothetical protein V6D02_11010 [Candidatus Obscuribacterales bacterium]